MAQTTDTDIREIKTAIATLSKGIESNTKAIADLTLEMRLGFASMDKKIDVGFSDIRGEIKDLKGQISTSEATLTGKINQLDERTKLGFWGFILRGTVLAILIALIPIVTKYLGSSLPEMFKP